MTESFLNKAVEYGVRLAKTEPEKLQGIVEGLIIGREVALMLARDTQDPDKPQAERSAEHHVQLMGALVHTAASLRDEHVRNTI